MQGTFAVTSAQPPFPGPTAWLTPALHNATPQSLSLALSGNRLRLCQGISYTTASHPWTLCAPTFGSHPWPAYTISLFFFLFSSLSLSLPLSPSHSLPLPPPSLLPPLILIDSTLRAQSQTSSRRSNFDLIRVKG